MRSHKFDTFKFDNFNTFREMIENCIGVQNEFKAKKQLKRAFLAFFGDTSGKNLNKTVTAQTSFPCYEKKGLDKKMVL